MKYTVDRIEGNYAVCENQTGGFENIALESIGFSVKEGDIIEKCGRRFSACDISKKEKMQSAGKRFDALKKKAQP